VQEKKQKKCEFLLFAYLVSFGFVFAIFVKRHAKSDDTGEDCKKDNYVYHWGCVVHVKRGGIGAEDGKIHNGQKLYPHLCQLPLKTKSVAKV